MLERLELTEKRYNEIQKSLMDPDVLKDQENMTRYGFSVSKRVGNSVMRHRVTRLLREAVRSYDNFVMEGNRIIIIARPSVREKSLKDIKDSIKQLYKLHGIWRSV